MDENYDDIDLKGLFVYILKKYKSIIVCVMVGCLLGCCFSFIKMNSNTPDNVLKTIEKADKDKLDIDEVKQYAGAVRLYNSMVAYENSSALMNLNANNVYKGVLSYGITSKENDTDEIAAYFESVLDRDGGWENLQKNTDGDYSISDLKELVSLEHKDKNDNNSENSNSYINNTGSNNASSKNGFYAMDITAYGKDESFVKSVLEFVSNEIEKTKSDVEKKKKEFQKKLKALYENNSDTKKEKFIYKPVEGLTVIGAIAEVIQVAEKRGETITAVVDNVRLTITKRSDSKKKLEEFYRKKILQRAKEKSR